MIALTRRPADSYEQYIEQVARNDVAREVKLADLSDNLANNNRLPKSPEVVARIERYSERPASSIRSPARKPILFEVR